VVLTPNRNPPPAKSTDTGAPAYDDDLSIPAFLRRDLDDQVETTSTDDAAGLPVVADTPSATSLLILDVARRELADAKTVDEVKSIRDKAIGLVAYVKQASDRQLEAEAVAIQMEAVRRLGQMMRQQKERTGLNKGGSQTRYDAGRSARPAEAMLIETNFVINYRRQES